MSLSTFSGIMTMRASIKRHPGNTDLYGGPVADGLNWQVVAENIHCMIYISSPKDVENGMVNLSAESVRAVFHSDADILRDDIIYEVKDKSGNSILTGTFKVDVVTERTVGASISHKAVILQRLRG